MMNDDNIKLRFLKVDMQIQIQSTWLAFIGFTNHFYMGCGQEYYQWMVYPS